MFVVILIIELVNYLCNSDTIGYDGSIWIWIFYKCIFIIFFHSIIIELTEIGFPNWLPKWLSHSLWNRLSKCTFPLLIHIFLLLFETTTNRLNALFENGIPAPLNKLISIMLLFLLWILKIAWLLIKVHFFQLFINGLDVPVTMFPLILVMIIKYLLNVFEFKYIENVELKRRRKQRMIYFINHVIV